MEGVNPPSAASWTYVNEWLIEPEAVIAARAKGDELHTSSISPATGQALAALAASVNASNIVEVGTGTGVSGAWLLAGMTADGVLTTIDVEADHQRNARETFVALGVDHVRTRLITGRALEVLPRLTEAGYDMVFVDGEIAEYPAILPIAKALLRPGGVLAFDDVFAGDALADPAQRDGDAHALREVVASIRDDEDFVPAMLTVGDGLLVAVLRASAEPVQQ